MRHCLEFIDLENPQVCCPSMRLKQRIMIRTEISGSALPSNGSVEHAADVDGGRGAAMDGDADEAACELVHHHEHPVAAQHDRLTTKEVHAPETVDSMADQRQP